MAHNISLRNFDSSHYTLSLPLILSSLSVRVYTCMPCVACMCVCVCYILIYMYMYIYLSLFFSFASSSLFLCEIISLHICVNVQLNNRRQWLDRMAFDDVFFKFSFFGCSQGGVVAPWHGALHSHPFSLCLS